MTNLALLRRKKGLSQQDLAALLSIPRPHVSLLENAWFRKVSLRVERELQNIFGQDWTFETLMQDPPNPKPDQEADKAGG